ncbi:MAG TPA: peroxiredoxin, partial [Acidimicrobiia bacterium]
MALSVGDTIPDVAVTVPGDDGMPKPAKTGELLGTGTVVLFAVPGAFTPGCSNFHLPGFVLRADDVKAKGVDVIACIAVNDAFVMDAWSKDQDAGAIQMIADGNGEFTKAVGLELDGSG